ncbi:MAG: hypothetical protein HKN42_06900 [Granulosicoccus sp.]|nr:hypothetical protein [Granulosicoccus sp.]
MIFHCLHNFERNSVQSIPLLATLLLAACGGGSSGDSTPDTPDEVDAVCTGDSTPPSNPVLYLSDIDGVRPVNLYLADRDQPEAGSVVVNGPLTAQQSIESFALSPDNRCVVYISDEDNTGRFSLYSVDLATPGVSARLNPALSANQDVLSFVISPDSREVLYTADQDVSNQTELFLVELAQPGVTVQVNPELIAEGDVSSRDIAFSPDGSQLLYAADQRTVGLFEIFLVEKSVPGVSAVVNGSFAEFVTLATGFGFSPDGNWIGYMADQDIDTIRELYAVDVSSLGNSVKLNPPYTGEEDLCTFEFRPDSQAVAYCADQDTEDKLELYAVSLDTPGISTKLNPPIVTGGEVRSDFQHAPGSDYIVYVADQETAGVDELYRVNFDSPGVSEKVNAALIDGGDVDLFEIRPDGLAIAYVADQDTNDVFELYQLSLVPPGEMAEKLNPARVGNDLIPIAYSADSAHIMYVADEAIAGRQQLYRIDLDEAGVSVQLNTLLVAGGQVFDFIIPR